MYRIKCVKLDFAYLCWLNAEGADGKVSRHAEMDVTEKGSLENKLQRQQNECEFVVRGVLGAHKIYGSALAQRFISVCVELYLFESQVHSGFSAGWVCLVTEREVI
jgi:hypothetical protein